MRKDYFVNCRCVEDLKELYRELAMKWHPDRGGDLEAMKAINAEFDECFEQLKNTRRNIGEDAAENPYYEASKATTETAGEFRNIIERLIILDGLVIELIGRWIWVTGETKKYKEILKELGFRWCGKKIAWSWHKKEDGTRSRGKYSMNEIRQRYGSTQFEKAPDREQLTA